MVEKEQDEQCENKQTVNGRRMLDEDGRYNIVSKFAQVNTAVTPEYLARHLRRQYSRGQIGVIIRDAIQEGLLYVDNVLDNGVVYLGLTHTGQSYWWSLNERRRIT